MIQELLYNPVAAFFLIYGLLVFRYTFIAGLAYLIIWKWKPQRFQKYRIQEKFPSKDKIRNEIKYSLVTFVFFSLSGAGIFYGDKIGIFEIFFDVSDYGNLYYLSSFVLILVFHDTYFYWMHRAIHWKKIYKYIHKVHHNSTNPSPFAAFSFHPYEAVFETLVLPLYLAIAPLHYTTIVYFLIVMTVLNVLGHLGYEFYPSGFTTSKFSKWINTSTHHNMHHKFFDCNYGLYLNFWDRVMGTNHTQYSGYFEKIKKQV